MTKPSHSCMLINSHLLDFNVNGPFSKVIMMFFFAKYYMKLKPQNVLVLSSNRIFTTFHKKYLHSLQSSIIHCSIIVILNYTFTFLQSYLHKHDMNEIYNLSTLLLSWCYNIYIDNRLFLTKSSLSFMFSLRCFDECSDGADYILRRYLLSSE